MGTNVVSLILSLREYFRFGHLVVFQANIYIITVDIFKYVSVKGATCFDLINRSPSG